MLKNQTRKTLLLLCVVFAMFILASACEKNTPSENPSAEPANQATATPDRPVSPQPAEPVAKPPEEPVAEPVAEPRPPEKKQITYRIHTDENNPEEFVELVAFNTVCEEPIGNLIGTGTLTINPTLENEREIPVERVTAIIFNKMGLIDPSIKGVGKLVQPIGYRENKVVLQNPDDEIEDCILVMCRDLEGITLDGAEWSMRVEKDAARQFHKIEIIRK